ncbi:MAG: chromosome segregation protein ScpA [Planctomycetes bacterium RBG_16_64_10]|nr:MAG: chromosome segregation protein ScpA [Planctomycetes bacterium RBG_16_64_10]
MEFCVDLDIFRGPLDLLLYLVRKHEVEIIDIPIASVTDQFLAHLEVLEQVDVSAAGEFLDVASTLIELKSRLVLPRGGEVDDALDLAQQELVRRLLEYKRYREAASMLEERSRSWQQRCLRLANDLPGRRNDPADQPIHEIELWDLVSALARMVRERAAAEPSNIVYDDTPIHVFMMRIHQGLIRRGRLALGQLFEPGMHKSTQVGLFLAVLELVRHHHVSAEQNRLFGEIWVLPGPNFGQPFDVASADNYEPHGAES